MKWIDGEANKSKVNEEYRAHYYYFTENNDPEIPWFEIFVHRTWDGKKYHDEWEITLLKDKDVICLSKITHNFDEIQGIVKEFEEKAEEYNHSYRNLIQVNGKEYPITFCQDKLVGKTDCTFYDGQIAKVTIGDYHFSLEAGGDIQFAIDGKDYKKGSSPSVEDAINEHELDDEKMENLDSEGRIIWSMNNWFEVAYKHKDWDSWDCAFGEVAFNYDSAIELLRSVIENVLGG